MADQPTDEHASESGDDEHRTFVQSIGDRVLGPRIHSAEGVARSVGLTVDDIEPIWMELGFAPADRSQTLFTDSDVDALHLLASARRAGLIDDESTVAMARVLGQTLARVAATQAQTIAGLIQQLPADHIPLGSKPAADGQRTDGLSSNSGTPNAGLDELADMVADTLVPIMDRFIAYTWRRHLIAALDRCLQPRVSQVVGFADLVGFTQLSTRIDVDAVPDMVSRFQELATQHLVSHDGRLVKTIGDAVLFVFPDAGSAARGSLALVAACAHDSTLPDIRAGLACGPVAELEGDIYGSTVNRAARLVELARSATVLVDEDTALQLANHPDIAIRPLRPRRLKGLGYIRAWAIRPRRPDDLTT